LVWSRNQTNGKFTIELRYKTMPEEGNEVELWWWINIWRLKVPFKTKIFMWLSLARKNLMQDVLQKITRQMIGICSLCKKYREYIDQLMG